MSRNLCSTNCQICRADEEAIVFVGPPHYITEKEAGVYFQEYGHKLMVAEAHCIDCGTLYLAWIRYDGLFHNLGARMADLSFRHAFNDEPAPEDLPRPPYPAGLARRIAKWDAYRT